MRDPSIRADEQTSNFGPDEYKQVVIVEFTHEEAVGFGFWSPEVCLIACEFALFAYFSKSFGNPFEPGFRSRITNKAAIDSLTSNSYQFSFDKMYDALLEAVDNSISNPPKEFKPRRLSEIMELSEGVEMNNIEAVRNGNKRKLGG